MNILQTKRATVRRLEAELTSAFQAKQKADATLASKLAQIEASEPKLPEGVIAQFSIDRGKMSARYPQGAALGVVGGSLALAQDGGKAPVEREAARLAQFAYVQASSDLQTARRELANFEASLRQLQEHISCLEDL